MRRSIFNLNSAKAQKQFAYSLFKLTLLISRLIFGAEKINMEINQVNTTETETIQDDFNIVS